MSGPLALGGLILSVCVTTVCGSTFTTSGDGGIPCPPGPRCKEVQAECSNNGTGDCVCVRRNLEQNRDGNLDCYKENERWGRGVNDPTYKMFDLQPQKVYKFVLPCRVLFSHTKTNLKVPEVGKVGTCECKTFTWNYKHEGKIFIGGVELTCRVERTYGPNFYEEFTSRVEGIASDGVYEYTEYGSPTFEDPSPAIDTQATINQGEVTYASKLDEDQNQIILDMKPCGVRMVYTAYDIELGKNQNFLPGFSVTLSCPHKPMYLSQDKVMCTGPEEFGGPTFASALLPGLDVPTSFQYRALASMVPQTQPHPNEECTYGATAVALCHTPAKRALSQERCNFMLHNHHFIKCVCAKDDGPSGEGLMYLYNECLRVVCNEAVSCYEFTQSLLERTTGCPPKATTDIPEYLLHYRGAWCPFQ